MNRRDQQTTDTLLMVRPSIFAFNDETASSNIFQQLTALSKNEISAGALKEFDDFVKLLRLNKIYVIVLQDDVKNETPDSIFPNNWISFQDGKIILYPMLAENRRRERKTDWIAFLKNAVNPTKVFDFTTEEKGKKFLEGTGSMVLDHSNRIAFANISSRTNEELFRKWCHEMKFEPVLFHSQTSGASEIYHTNVIMSIGEQTTVICSAVIRNEKERTAVEKKLSVDRQVIEITEEQMNHFCGNLLLVKNREGKNFWVMSEQAFDFFTPSQREILKQDGELLYSNLETIERVGGGSARCMVAEIF
jgi:hypothetical protein